MAPFEKGQVLTAAQLNALADKLIDRISGGKGVNARKFGNRIIIESNAAPDAITPSDRWFVVVNVRKDICECREWNFSTGAIISGSPTILVAKPLDIRGSTWSAKTIDGVAYVSTDGTAETSGHKTRTADGAAQTISPTYVESVTIGSLLNAKRLRNTGISYQGKKVFWQDISSRKWTGESAGEIFALYQLQSNATLTSGAADVSLDFTGGEVENVGSGFSLEGGTSIKVLAPADGKLIRLETTIELLSTSLSFAHIRAQFDGLPLISNAGITLQGMGDNAGGGVAQHYHDVPSGNTNRLLCFGWTFRATLDESYLLEIRQENSDGGGSGLDLSVLSSGTTFSAKVV